MQICSIIKRIIPLISEFGYISVKESLMYLMVSVIFLCFFDTNVGKTFSSWANLENINEEKSLIKDFSVTCLRKDGFCIGNRI